MFTDTSYGLSSDHQFCFLDFESTTDHLLHSDSLIDPILQPRSLASSTKKDLHVTGKKLSNRNSAFSYDCPSLNERNSFPLSSSENYNQLLLDQVLCNHLSNELNFDKKRAAQNGRNAVRSASPSSSNIWPLNSKEHLNSLLRQSMDPQNALFDWNALWTNKEKPCKFSKLSFNKFIKLNSLSSTC